MAFFVVDGGCGQVFARFFGDVAIVVVGEVGLVDKVAIYPLFDGLGKTDEGGLCAGCDPFGMCLAKFVGFGLFDEDVVVIVGVLCRDEGFAAFSGGLGEGEVGDGKVGIGSGSSIVLRFVDQATEVVVLVAVGVVVDCFGFEIAPIVIGVGGGEDGLIFGAEGFL